MMEVKIVNEEKNVMEVEIPNLTAVEVIREYLNHDKSVKFAAWKRKHPSNPPVLRVESSNPKKSLKDAIDKIVKEADKLNSEIKKA